MKYIMRDRKYPLILDEVDGDNPFISEELISHCRELYEKETRKDELKDAIKALFKFILICAIAFMVIIGMVHFMLGGHVRVIDCIFCFIAFCVATFVMASIR